MDFEVQNSIVPAALNLARFKVAGNLPSLQMNFSDTKYKTLMRLVDVTIPKFDDDAPASARVQATAMQKTSSNSRPDMSGRNVSGAGFGLSFWEQSQEYNVDTDDDEDDKDDDNAEQFFETEGSRIVARPELHQHIFELAFSVDQLRVLVSKTNSDSEEKLLGDVNLERFALDFALAKFDMQVDVRLRYE
jgi:vacuolar protein sorting-associated protein 13A/C